MKSRLTERLALAILSAVALVTGTGCSLDDAATPISVITGIQDITVCYPDPFAGATGYSSKTFQVLPDGSSKQTGSGFNTSLKDCSYSVGSEDQVEPSIQEMSAPTTTSSAPAPGTTSEPPTRAALANGPPHLVNALPYARPLPFMPAFSSADANLATANCDPASAFYQVNHSTSSVSHVAGCPTAILANIPVTSNPLEAVLTPDAKLLLVTSYDNAVSFIDTSTDTVVSTLKTPNYYPSGIAISPDGTTAYVTNYFDENPGIIVINIASRSISSFIPLPIAYPKQIFLTADGSQAWVNFYSNTVIYILDTLTGTVSVSINVGGTASTGIAFNATGTKAFIAVTPSDLKVYDTATLGQVADITVGARPVEVKLSPDGGFVYVTSLLSPNISVINAHTNKLAATIQSPAADQRGLVLLPMVP